MPNSPLSLRTLTLVGATTACFVAMASAQDAQDPAACAGLAADSAEAAILGCTQSTAVPTLSDQEPADEPNAEDFDPPLAAPASEPLADAAVVDPEPIAEPVPEALRAPLPARNDEPLGDATDEGIASSELPRTPPAEDLVAFFADWLERHPLGETVDPAEAELLEAVDLPAGLPPLPPSRRYAELDGMIVEIDPETEELLRLVRRAETAVGDPDILAGSIEEVIEEVVEEVVEEDNDEPRGSNEEERQREDEEVREQEERAAAERAEEERQREEERQDDQGGNEAQAFDIPNGHMPPPGSCRVWFPDREPGQQPPPTSCDVEVPAGAVLIQR